MRSPVCPVVCNQCMDEHEEKALAIALNPLRIWKYNVDNWFTHSHEKSIDCERVETRMNGKRAIAFSHVLVLV